MPHSVRPQFPALTRRHAGQPVAYFDGPGGTQVPTSVVDAVADYLYRHNANTHWQYPTSVETDSMLLDARQAYADLFGARTRDEIAFGANMTTLTFHVARGLGRGWGAGDDVIVTDLDHHANVAPWRALERERGITVRVVPFDPATGELDLDVLARVLGPRTRLVAVGAASNALGTVNPIDRIVEMAHAAGALVFVDAVHFAAHGAIDVQAWGCDLLACSAYKLYGPHIGVLYGRHDLLATIDVPKLIGSPDTAPERIETGTQNHEGIVGARAAVDFLASLAPAAADGTSRRARLVSAFGALHSEGESLLWRLWDGLSEIPGVRLYGPPPGRPRTPTMSFTVRDLSADDVARHLAQRALFLSSGDFYANSVLDTLGVSARGLVRAGCACYTTADEVDRLIAGVAGIGD